MGEAARGTVTPPPTPHARAFRGVLHLAAFPTASQEPRSDTRTGLAARRADSNHLFFSVRPPAEVEAETSRPKMRVASLLLHPRTAFSHHDTLRIATRLS